MAALRENVPRMMERMTHRGPDGSGSHFIEHDQLTVGLGHQRLSILDLSSAGKQPMPSDNRRTWIVYNGEVYNFRELRTELELAGHRFRSTTDTEVVLRSYEAWGIGCLQRLEGMFAFAIWDDAERKLLIARDRVGIKPLHYAATPSGLSFSSEIKSLLALNDVDSTVDPKTIDEFLTLGYISAPRTAFKEIRKLMPGHYALWQKGKLHCVRYWSRQYGPSSASRSDFREEFLDVFGGAVKRQMVSDVPLGSFLSGGIDSSLIVRMMREATTDSIQTFAIGFGDSSRDETAFAAEVATRFETKHSTSLASPDAIDLLPKLVKQLDEPFADSSIIPTYLVSRETRKSVKVALSGDGGDELFAGYTNYVGERILKWMRVLPSPILGVLGAGARIKSLSRHRILRRLDNVLSSRDLLTYQRYVEKASLCQPSLRSGLYTPSFEAESCVDPLMEDLDNLMRARQFADPVEELGALDFEFYLPNDMLAKVDRMSMLCSLEVRVPFLDERVVEFASSVPSRAKLRGLTTKYLLRQALSDVLPPRITMRSKRGFELPVDSWFSGQFGSYAEEILMDKKSRERGYFEPSAIKSILADHRSGRSNQARLIFALICLELWFRLVVDQEGV